MANEKIFIEAADQNLGGAVLCLGPAIIISLFLPISTLLSVL